MGRRKVDKTKFIESQQQRKVAFCKRRRGLLKKAIEMSMMCNQRVLLVIFDPEKDKAIHFSSDPTFSFEGAHREVSRIAQSEDHHNLEVFDSEDYEKFEQADFRTLRRNNKPVRSEGKEILVKNLINADQTELRDLIAYEEKKP